MKKLFFALCAVAALGLTACHKDDNQPSGGGGNHQDEIPSGEGIYNPAMHITSVIYDDERLPEFWLWQDRKLQSINEDENCGAYSTTASFSYDGWRLVQAEMFGDMPATIGYTYADGKLSRLDIATEGMPIANADVMHTGDKITHIDINVNEQMIQMILQMLSQDYNPFKMQSADLGAGIVRATKAATHDGKLSVSSTSFAADLVWDGDNVSRMVLNAEVVLGVTIEELRQMLPLDSIAGNLASLLSYISAGQELPLTVTIHDTTEMTYDSHNNPLQGFLGRIDASMLSANNVTSLTNSGVMNADLTISIPILGDQHIPYSMPLGDGITQTFNYTYNNAGFPAMMEDGNGIMTIYSYQEE